MINTPLPEKGNMAERAMPPKIDMPEQKIPTGRILRAGAIALPTAIVANAVVFLVEKFILRLPLLMSPFSGTELVPLPILDVVIATAVGVIGATIVFVLVNRFTKSPVRNFRIISLLFLLFSFGGPLTLPSEVLFATRLALAAMHVVAGFVIVSILTGKEVTK